MWSIFSYPDWGITDADDDVRASVGYDCEGHIILAFLQRQECKHNTSFKFMLNVCDRLLEPTPMLLLLPISSQRLQLPCILQDFQFLKAHWR